MVADAPARGLGITVGEDARITRIGRWLRRSKFDELPQLIDVLTGHMSLVGPRPELPRYVARYPADLREQVLQVRPGITDPASLQYADEAALLALAADPEREYLEVLLPAKLRISADYARRATFTSDLRVLAQTLRLLSRAAR
jgi:lipopolysaccharide/colanic/teichoic acid biosynthesis glycosyltransferase